MSLKKLQAENQQLHDLLDRELKKLKGEIEKLAKLQNDIISELETEKPSIAVPQLVKDSIKAMFRQKKLKV